MDIVARAAVSRHEWRRRVERWKSSGLTAKEFAAQIDINVGTLYHWQWKLKSGRLERLAVRSDAIAASLVEVHAPAVGAVGQAFEVEVANGRRVRVAAGFDPEALRRLLAVVEAA